jgi:P27 family predicted phage terminase small subunit
MAAQSRSGSLSAAEHEPPAHLSQASQALWRRIVPKRAKSPGRLALLTTALGALDRADAAGAVIEREGMVLTGKAGSLPHAHPLLRVEKDSRALFARCWADLHLGWDQSDGDRWP